MILTHISAREPLVPVVIEIMGIRILVSGEIKKIIGEYLNRELRLMS